MMAVGSYPIARGPSQPRSPGGPSIPSHASRPKRFVLGHATCIAAAAASARIRFQINEELPTGV